MSVSNYYSKTFISNFTANFLCEIEHDSLGLKYKERFNELLTVMFEIAICFCLNKV